MFAADIAALPAGVLLLNQERSLLTGVKPGGCRRSKELHIFWVWVARGPFNAVISLRILVSTKKILGTRAETFSPREKIVDLYD